MDSASRPFLLAGVLPAPSVIEGKEPAMAQIMADKAGRTEGRNIGRPPILRADEATLSRFFEFGYAGKTQSEIAQLLGVHVNTISNFYTRAPQARRALLQGADKRREEDAAAWAAERAKLDAQEALAKNAKGRWARAKIAGQVSVDRTPGPCPTCGHDAGPSADTLTFSVAELAEARKQFEDLLDRHIAARRARLDEEQRD
jgi:hypothetical protein